MAKPKGVIVAQFDWTFVKSVANPYGEGEVFDIWQWNLFKTKWTRLSNTACGYGELSDASRDAQKMSNDIQTMLDANRSIPPRP